MVKQVAAVLTQLEGVWMDLPPNVAASVRKLLSRQQNLGIHSDSTTMETPRTSPLQACVQDITAPASSGTVCRRSAEDKLSGRWLSFGEAFGSSPMLGSCSWRPATVIAKPDESQSASKDVVASWGWPEASEAEALLDLPGGNKLVAEMDMLCGVLQRDLTQAFEDLREATETVRCEARVQQKKMEELILRGEEAQKAELDLCGAQLSELKESISRIWSDEGALRKDHISGCGVSDVTSGLCHSYGGVHVQVERCRADLKWCQSSVEQRSQASFEHARWLEEYTEQRLNSVQSALNARQREFNEELRAVWDRKAFLVARLREHFGEASDSSVHDIIPEHHHKELKRLEEASVEQLRALVKTSGEADDEQLLRLKEVVGDMKAKAKSANTLFNSLLAQCRSEVQEKVHDSLSSVHAASRLDKLATLSSAWDAWYAEIIAARFGGLQGKLATEAAQKENLCDKLVVAEALRNASQTKLRTLQDSMDAYSCMQKERDLSHWIHQLLQSWASVIVEAKQQRLVSEVASRAEEARRFATELQASSVSAAGFAKKLRRAERCLEESAGYLLTRLADRLLALTSFAAWALVLRTSWANIAALALEEERTEAKYLACKRDVYEAATTFLAGRADRFAAQSRMLHLWRELVLAEGELRNAVSSSFAISRMSRQTQLTTAWTAWRAVLIANRLDELQRQLAMETVSKEQMVKLLERTEAERSSVQVKLRSVRESMEEMSLVEQHRCASQWLLMVFRDWTAIVVSAKQASLRTTVASVGEEIASVSTALQASHTASAGLKALLGRARNGLEQSSGYFAVKIGDRLLVATGYAAWALLARTARASTFSSALEHEQAEVKHLVSKCSGFEAALIFLASRADRHGTLQCVLQSWREAVIEQAFRRNHTRLVGEVVDRAMLAQSSHFALLHALGCWKEAHVYVLMQKSDAVNLEQERLAAAYRLQMKTQVLKLLDRQQQDDVDAVADQDTADSDSEGDCDANAPETPPLPYLEGDQREDEASAKDVANSTNIAGLAAGWYF